MRVSITGSRGITISFADIDRYLPAGTIAIISGGAVGVDRVAEAYAREHDLELVVIRPDYASTTLSASSSASLGTGVSGFLVPERSRRIAPLLRNTEIVSQAEYCLFFWDGVSKGTSHTIGEARRLGRRGKIVISGLVSHSFDL